MVSFVSNVLELKLPAATKLLLDARCPLNGVGGVVLGWQENVLGLRVELRYSWSRDLRLGKGIAGDGADGPRTGETYGSGRRCLRLADCSGIRRVLLVSLGGEEVDLVIAQ